MACLGANCSAWSVSHNVQTSATSKFIKPLVQWHGDRHKYVCASCFSVLHCLSLSKQNNRSIAWIARQFIASFRRFVSTFDLRVDRSNRWKHVRAKHITSNVNRISIIESRSYIPCLRLFTCSPITVCWEHRSDPKCDAFANTDLINRCLLPFAFCSCASRTTKRT